jgi:hypothetical protein
MGFRGEARKTIPHRRCYRYPGRIPAYRQRVSENDPLKRFDPFRPRLPFLSWFRLMD